MTEQPLRRRGSRSEGPQHFLVGIVGGFALRILTAVSLGWPL